MSGAPTHAIWHIRDREGKKAFWTEIGVGFTNRDGSITLKMNLVPIDGGMIVVKPLDRDGRDWRDRDDDWGAPTGLRHQSWAFRGPRPLRAGAGLVVFRWRR